MNLRQLNYNNNWIEFLAVLGFFLLVTSIITATVQALENNQTQWNYQKAFAPDIVIIDQAYPEPVIEFLSKDVQGNDIKLKTINKTDEMLTLKPIDESITDCNMVGTCISQND